ncbi:hypothetical protein AAFP30_06160 [Gordonia sp. CPCC 205515]|uniref:hypothetical protein n=1 Tax=Gordonia sp. CPCC 205515 TaxID=3140791 RepID=UPI003AF39406
MTTRTRPTFRPLIVVVAVVAIVLVGFVIWRGNQSVAEQDRGKAAATARCIAALRDDMRTTFETKGGNSVADSEKLAEAAQFTEVKVKSAELTDEQRQMVQNQGNSVDSIDRAWRISGALVIPGFARSGATYGPNNTFACRTVVFKDGSATVIQRQIN